MSVPTPAFIPLRGQMAIICASGVELEERAAIQLRGALALLAPVRGDTEKRVSGLPPWITSAEDIAAQLRMLDWALGYMGWGREFSAWWDRGWRDAGRPVRGEARADG